MLDRRLILSSYMTELLSAGRVSFARDEAIGLEDVEIPAGRLADTLFAEQMATFDVSRSV